jgi:hypothetical protein
MADTSKEFHIPVDELKKMVPMLLRGEAGKFFLMLDELDLNHDHKRDVAQVARLALVVMPFASKANEFVDFNLLADWICELPFITNKALAKSTIHLICTELEKA